MNIYLKETIKKVSVDHRYTLQGVDLAPQKYKALHNSKVELVDLKR